MKKSSKKTTEIRIIAILTAFSIFAGYLLFNIFRLDFLNYEHYKNKTYDQVTTSTTLIAKRGNIYDSNMNTLAQSNTVWRIFVSPREIKAKSEKDNEDYARLISDTLGNILSKDRETIYKKISNSKILDVTIKKDATEDEYRKTVTFIKKFGLDDILFTESETSRYYPEGSFAAHVLGFVGSDSQGLYGLEYYYDELLSGKNGYYLYAKDANGKALDTEYSTYIPAEDGYSIVTTIDSYIQAELEAIIESARINHDANNRVCGVVMDTNTGAILAMATSSPFDPNDPFTLDTVSAKKLSESGYIVGTEEYKKYKTELMQIMWSNKAVSETYEPGSTFKIVTVSAALDLGVVSTSDTFSCCGYATVGGWRIRCHKTTGHGSGFSLAYGLQMSCNPCMISLSERVGAKSFYSYVDKFGYLEKSGIDLPSEADTIFHKEENISETELATASFGQRFKVSVINHLTAISAVANDGKLVTPYIVERVIDKDGKTVSEHEVDIRREVISEDVAKVVSEILIEGVSGDGGAKNAAVIGYDIAAKTGTSQKFDVLDENGNSYLRIGSTVAYATDSGNGIATIIVVDEPSSSVKYGSVVAAPYVSKLLEKILPYLEYKSSENIENVKVESFVGLNINTATQNLKKRGLSYEIIGSGDTVTGQMPKADDIITYPISKIILYAGEENTSELLTVPNLAGLNLSDAIKTTINAGFNIRLSGISAAYPDSDDVVVEQSLPPGEKAKKGYVIILRAINTQHED